MYPVQEVIEGQAIADQNNEFAVKYEALGVQVPACSYNFGKVASQGAAGLGLQFYAITIAKHEASEAVPLRLVLPLRADRRRLDRLRFHRGAGEGAAATGRP
jgi:hypothetical protein